MQVGQKVFAIGFPFALDQSLTAGIVSGLGREITGVSGRTIRDVVQTDAGVLPSPSPCRASPHSPACLLPSVLPAAACRTPADGGCMAQPSTPATAEGPCWTAGAA